jgi:flagellar motor switch protein FliG
MKLSEVLEAQKSMITTARNLAKEGTIMMGGGEDDYV